MSENTTPDGGQPQPSQTQTFTQEQLDQIVKDRLTREKSKYADYDQLKASAAKLAELENANKSEAQKLADRLAALEKAIGEKDAAIAERDKALAAATRAAKVASVASGLGALDAYDANIIQVTSAIDPSDPKADDQIKQALEQLQQKKPYLFAAKAPAPSPGLTTFNPTGTPGSAMTDAQLVKDVMNKAGRGSFGPF